MAMMTREVMDTSGRQGSVVRSHWENAPHPKNLQGFEVE